MSEDIWNEISKSCFVLLSIYFWRYSSHLLVVACKKNVWWTSLSIGYWRKANFVQEKQWKNFFANCVAIHMKLWSDTSFNLSFKADLVCNHSLFCFCIHMLSLAPVPKKKKRKRKLYMGSIQQTSFSILYWTNCLFRNAILQSCPSLRTSYCKKFCQMQP